MEWTLAVVDWTQVILAAIAAVVTIANGLGIAVIYSHIRTPSRRSIGKQVEDVNHTARSNWHMLDAVRRDVGTTQPTKAVREVEAVDGLGEDDDQ